VWWVRLEERRLDYRALAEALRVRRAWDLGGVGRSVARTYLGQLRGEVAWVRRAMQHLCPPSWFWEEQFGRLSDDQKVSRLKQVHRSWVQQQEKQHHKEREREHFWAFLYRVFGFGLALLGLALFVVLLVLGLAGPEHAPGGHGWLDPAHPRPELLVAGSMLIILGGLLVAVCERRAHEELARQYDRMHVVFWAGSREMAAALEQAPPDVGRAQAILTELGREPIHESAQWLLLRRSKPMELPLGA
jgi:hypothetical protein